MKTISITQARTNLGARWLDRLPAPVLVSHRGEIVGAVFNAEQFNKLVELLDTLPDSDFTDELYKLLK